MMFTVSTQTGPTSDNTHLVEATIGDPITVDGVSAALHVDVKAWSWKGFQFQSPIRMMPLVVLSARPRRVLTQAVSAFCAYP